MDFCLTDEQQLLRQTVREFAEAEIKPHVREWDDAQHFPADLVPKMAALGLMGVQFPESYGGAGMSAIDYCICIEELSRVDPSVALSVAAHNGLGPAHIAMFGTEAQKRRWLVPLAKGEQLGAWGLTEPGAGSDAAGTRTTAVREADEWVLDGTKTFITNGASADVMVVMAVTDRSRGAKGISAFVVERGTPGLSLGKPDRKMGQRGAHTCDVVFEGCRIPAGNLIGGREGAGFKTAMKVLDKGRLHIAAVCVAAAERMLGDALRYAMERRQFGQPIAQFELIQAMLADSRAEIYAARSMVIDAARRRDEGRDVSTEAACAKLFASEMCGRVADRAVQIHGGAGYVSDYAVERFYRDVRLFRIYEGTSQILQLVIARNMIRDHAG